MTALTPFVATIVRIPSRGRDLSPASHPGVEGGATFRAGPDEVVLAPLAGVGHVQVEYNLRGRGSSGARHVNKITESGRAHPACQE
jgi:hypothetical protein